MLRVYVKTPGSTWVEYTPVLRPDRSFEIGGRAYNGEADQGEITVDDPDYTLDIFTDIAGHREVKITEDDSGSELILSLGRIGPKSMERGAHPIGREVTITVEDVNAELRGIIVNKFNRPAESGLTRVKALRLDYLRGSASTSSLARDSTDIDIDLFVPEDDEITMPAKFYDSTTPLDVLRECAEWEGKNFFVYPADNGDKELFYARPNDFSLHQCTLDLSDNPNVVDNVTVFEPWWIAGPALNMDPLETTTGIQFIHPDGQRTYDNDPAAEAIFDKWEESMFVDEAPGTNADNHLAAVIVARNHEERRRQCAVRLPGSQAHLIKQGMIITVQRARAAALSTSIQLRIANFRLKWLGPDADDDNAYLAILTLEHPVKLGRHWGGNKPGASSSPKPAKVGTWSPQDPCIDGGAMRDDFTEVGPWDGYVSPLGATWDETHGTAASIQVSGRAFLAARATEVGVENRHQMELDFGGAQSLPLDMTSLISLYPPAPGDPFDVIQFSLNAHDSTDVLSYSSRFYGLQSDDGTLVLTVFVRHGPGAFQIASDSQNVPGTFVPGRRIYHRLLCETSRVRGKAWYEGNPEPDDWLIDIDFTPGEIDDWGFIRYTNITSASQVGGNAYVHMLCIGDGLPGATPCGECAPSGGDFVSVTAIGYGNGSQTLFFITLGGAYDPGSLSVWVDGLVQEVIETDPSTGAFSLTFAPESDELVQASWRTA